MRAVGGFLGLEPTRGVGQPYHRTTALSTGRSCLVTILERLRPRRLHLPFYVCDVVVRAVEQTGTCFEFYAIDDQLEIAAPLPGCQPDELLLYVNYFGLKSRYLRVLAELYSGALVVDDCQAFYRRGLAGSWSFNSARKFFGVPDGAYLYGPPGERLPALSPSRVGHRHLVTRLAGDLPKAREQFLEHEARLDHVPRAMSILSRAILRDVDYGGAAAARRRNFRTLGNSLGDRNLLDCALDDDAVPLYYPFLWKAPLRRSLRERGIFVPCLWPELGARTEAGFEHERAMAQCLCLLPIDQRYDERAMKRVIAEVSRLVAA